MKKIANNRTRIDVASVEDEIQTVIATTIGCTGVEEMYLFGSAAENQMTENSDLDILLVFASDKDMTTGRKNLEAKFPLVPRAVDLVWMSREEFNKKKVIGGVAYTSSNFGRLLYQKKA